MDQGLSSAPLTCLSALDSEGEREEQERKKVSTAKEGGQAPGSHLHLLITGEVDLKPP